MAIKHDCWNPACLVAQGAGQSLALCLGCQIIRDTLRCVGDRDCSLPTLAAAREGRLRGRAAVKG